MSKGTALVIGAGVSGLTSALCLRRCGWEVTLVADKFSPHVTSNVAGALWEYPPAICSNYDAALLKQARRWSLISYESFERLARTPDTGVSLRPVTFFFRRPLADAPEHFEKMNELKSKVRDFVHDPALAKRDGINPEFGLLDAYSYTAPMIDTDAYLPWLQRSLIDSGGRIETRQISGSLVQQPFRLLREFRADLIVNCTGLGAKELAHQPMYPLRGALIRARNDGLSIPPITKAYCVPQGECADKDGFVFIVPRGRDMLVLGGLAEANQSDLAIDLRNHRPLQTMLDRCVDFMPALKRIRIDDAEPVRIGLRPMRVGGVRVCHEPNTQIIHNIGHGASGVTLSWGCGFEVADIAAQI